MYTYTFCTLFKASQGLAVFMSCYDFILHHFGRFRLSPVSCLSSPSLFLSVVSSHLVSLAVNYVKVVNSV